METKLRASRMETIKASMRFDNVFTVDCIGQSGGLVLLWKNEFSVDTQKFSRRHINATVSLRGKGQKWKLTGMYVHLHASQRKKTWSLFVVTQIIN
jgi:hypothetical protein